MIKDNEIENIIRKTDLTPCLKIVICFIIGIMAGLYSALLIPLCFFRKTRYLMPHVAVIITGAMVMWFHSSSLIRPTDTYIQKTTIRVKAILNSDIISGEILSPQTSSSLRGTYVVIHIDTSFKNRLNKGDIISAEGYLEDINISYIDTKSYLANLYRQGYRQRFTCYGDTVTVLSRSTTTLYNKASHVKERVSDRLSGLNISGKDVAILKAIGIGDKTELRSSTVRTYNNGGISHILAISGLHVGVLALILNIMLCFMNKVFVLRIVKSVLIIAILWCYAYVSGLSASVCRAAIMFSMFQVAFFETNRNMIQYNILAAAAFIMLAVNPALLYDVGFQLSFTAVFAIIFVLPKVEVMLKTENKFIRYIVLSVAVTLAIQLFALPLLLYHFGMITFSGIINNIIVVALLPALMLSLIIYLVYPNIIADKTLDLLISTINTIVENTSSIDFLIIKNIDISVYYAMFMAVIIIFIAIYIELWWNNYIDKMLYITKKKSRLA